MESESQEVVLPLRKLDGRKPFGSGAVFKPPGRHRPRLSSHLAFPTEKKKLYHPKGGRWPEFVSVLLYFPTNLVGQALPHRPLMYSGRMEGASSKFQGTRWERKGEEE